MSESKEPDLVKVTEVFLVPCSFLVAALGTADTNMHRALVSLVGLIVAVMWWRCSKEALADLLRQRGPVSDPLSTRTRMFLWMPPLFVGGWIVALIGHLMLWNQPLGK